jgi:hypothetical protein
MVAAGGGGPRRLGTEVEISECAPQPDGRFHLEVVGRRRFAATEVWEEDGYAVAAVRWLPLPPPVTAAAEPEPTAEPEQENASPETATLDAARVDAERASQPVEGTARELEGLADEWGRLVRDGGWERWHGQLARVQNDLGPMPPAEAAVDRALWASQPAAARSRSSWGLSYTLVPRSGRGARQPPARARRGAGDQARAAPSRSTHRSTPSRCGISRGGGPRAAGFDQTPQALGGAPDSNS